MKNNKGNLRASEWCVFKYAPLFLALFLGSCGWQLRGYDEFKNAELSSTSRPASLDIQFSRRKPELLQTLHTLARTHSIDISPNSPVVLNVLSIDVDRRHQAVTETGVAAQFELTQTLRYTLTNKAIRQPPQTHILFARRSYDFDAAQIVAKNQEEQALLSEMRRELARKMLMHSKAFFLKSQPEKTEIPAPTPKE